MPESATCHSSNSIKNWRLQVKLNLSHPKFCASSWKLTSIINHWISAFLPVVWTSTLIFMMPEMALYSDQVKNRVALSGMQMTPGSRMQKAAIAAEFIILSKQQRESSIALINSIFNSRQHTTSSLVSVRRMSWATTKPSTVYLILSSRHK